MNGFLLFIHVILGGGPRVSPALLAVDGIEVGRLGS